MLVVFKHLHKWGVQLSPWNITLQSLDSQWCVFLLFPEVQMIAVKYWEWKTEDSSAPCHARSDDNMTTILCLTPGGTHTDNSSTTAGIVTFEEPLLLSTPITGSVGESKDAGLIWCECGFVACWFKCESTTEDLSVIHKRFCHQSWKVRWQRPAQRTAGSCNPVWKCHQLFVQTASQCSPLEKAKEFINGAIILINK